MQTQATEIGYILKGYPRTSETFIINEIFLLEQTGLKLSIFSIKRLEGQKQHGVVSRIKAPVTYLPQIVSAENSSALGRLWRNVPGFASSHWRLLRRRPAAYARTLLEALWMRIKYRHRAFIKEFLQAGFIASEVVASGRIGHLHAHFCHTSASVAMLASALAGVPFSFTAHAKDIYRDDMNPGDLLRVKLARAKFAVTCTRANHEYLDRLRAYDRGAGEAQPPLYTIYHGLDLSLFVSAECAQPCEPPLILSVGRLVEKKGFTYLVDACRLLKDRGHDFRCRIVGGTDVHAEAVKQRVAQLQLDGVITLHSAVTQEELRGVYQQATLFALPCQVTADGDRDGIPNVLVEAMAMELPVVSTNISGIPELIQDRANGLLVPQKDARALADAMETLLNDAALCRQLGRAARQTVCRDFDAKRNIQALRTLFDSTEI